VTRCIILYTRRREDRKILVRKSEVDKVDEMYMKQCPGHGVRKLQYLIKGQFIPPSKEKLQVCLHM
jgi:hypothetical protein